MSISGIAMSQMQVTQNSFITRVYSWMAMALAITGLVAYTTASSEQLLNLIVGTPIFYGLIIGELILVIVLSAAIRKMSPLTATMVFILYSAVNGLTLSVIFMAYTMGSIASTFFITAGTFGAMSVYGYITKKDLTTVGHLAFMGLIGLIIASIVNIFFASPILYWITTYAGILIFVALTAYDTQKIKKLSMTIQEGSDDAGRYAILGALTLYLDFINLFLYLLRIFGNRRSSR